MRRFQPVSPGTSLTEKVIQQIWGAIINHEYKPGDRLPSENELAEAFRVSRTSIREAIKVLAGKGLVEVRRGVGVFVADPIEEGVLSLSNLQEIVINNKDKLLELSVIRKVLESEAAAWAAENATPEDIAKMAEVVDLAMQAAADPRTAASQLKDLNGRFHHHLVQATGNQTLLQMMNTLRDTLSKAREILLHFPGRYSGSVEGHRAILEAIKKRDSKRAKAAMLKHLSAVEDTVLFMAQGKSADQNEMEEKK